MWVAHFSQFSSDSAPFYLHMGYGICWGMQQSQAASITVRKEPGGCQTPVAHCLGAAVLCTHDPKDVTRVHKTCCPQASPRSKLTEVARWWGRGPSAPAVTLRETVHSSCLCFASCSRMLVLCLPPFLPGWASLVSFPPFQMCSLFSPFLPAACASFNNVEEMQSRSQVPPRTQRGLESAST